MDNIEQRQRLVEEARRWLGTPYKHRGAVLGAGCDCVQLLIQSSLAAGLIDDADAAGKYTCDWHLHRSEERYLEGLERFAARVDDSEDKLIDRPRDFTAETGDILMFQVGRTFSHSAIVTGWPYIIHSYLPSIIVEEVSILGTPMAERHMRVYSYWGKR